jgi:hypothetical protein
MICVRRRDLVLYGILVLVALAVLLHTSAKKREEGFNQSTVQTMSMKEVHDNFQPLKDTTFTNTNMGTMTNVSIGQCARKCLENGDGCGGFIVDRTTERTKRTCYLIPPAHFTKEKRKTEKGKYTSYVRNWIWNQRDLRVILSSDDGRCRQDWGVTLYKDTWYNDSLARSTGGSERVRDWGDKFGKKLNADLPLERQRKIEGKSNEEKRGKHAQFVSCTSGQAINTKFGVSSIMVRGPVEYKLFGPFPHQESNWESGSSTNLGSGWNDKVKTIAVRPSKAAKKYM